MPLLTLLLTASVLAISIHSEAEWHGRDYDRALRQVVALPSIAVGTNYEGTRNPLIEVFVRPLYDIPGGYDYVLASSFIDTPMRIGEFRDTVPGFNYTAIKG
ncbi:MAG: hypothetical protein QFX35_04215 [Candidatus Verstraetearchaeota archaeon]|nr:hypothetical protein [Candidatus Verstraetearchaeota archaeon]